MDGASVYASKKNRVFVYISDATELASFCERAGKSRIIAVDTEFIREHTYYPQLCLIQVSYGPESACIDPILIKDLSPLVDLLVDESVTKVFHACSQDLEVIKSTLGCDVAPVFDTQVAAAFLGLRQQIGYGALVEAYTGVHLPKAESLTDWSRRPLDPEQLKYAEDDVNYLPGIYQEMMDDLTKRGRLGWVIPEMEEVSDPVHFSREPDLAYLHLKRAGSLTRKQLAVARELCAWRERIAADHDIPRKWVVSDEVIVEACRRTPRTVERLRKIRGAESISGQEASMAIEAIKRGVDCPPDDMPHKTRHSRPSQEMEGVLGLMFAMLRVIADKNEVAAQLVATKDDLLDFVDGDKDCRLRKSSWRYELVGRELEGLLDGQVGLTVKDGHIELL